MNTLNFDQVPQYTIDTLAAATLAAVRRHMAAEEDRDTTTETAQRKEG